MEQQIGDPLWCFNNYEKKSRIEFIIHHLRRELLTYPPLVEYYGRLSETYINKQSMISSNTDIELSSEAKPTLDFSSLVFHLKLIELLQKDDGMRIIDPEMYRRLKFLSDKLKEDLRNNPELLAFQDQAYDLYIQQQRAGQGDIAVK